MRVFQLYGADIHKSQIPFKEMFSFIEGFLQKNGWTYNQILFDFEIYNIPGEPPQIEDFLSKYPYWQSFHIQPANNSGIHRFTNAPETKTELYTDKWSTNKREDHALVDLDCLSALMSKVPRPLNIPGFTVMFDGIDLLSSGGDGSIRFTRSIWPSGANTKIVAIVELTDKVNQNNIINDSQLASKLKEQFFGVLKTPYDGKRRCEFTDEENRQIEKHKRDIEPLIAEFCKKTQMEDQTNGDRIATDMGTRFSVKKPISTFFNGWEYRYEPQGMYFLTKPVKYGYRMTVDLGFKPGMDFLERFVSISGINFDFPIAYDRITRSSQKNVDDFVADCRRITDDAEQTLIDPLFQLFGETPSWYFVSKG